MDVSAAGGERPFCFVRLLHELLKYHVKYSLAAALLVTFAYLRCLFWLRLLVPSVRGPRPTPRLIFQLKSRPPPAERLRAGIRWLPGPAASLLLSFDLALSLLLLLPAPSLRLPLRGWQSINNLTLHSHALPLVPACVCVSVCVCVCWGGFVCCTHKEVWCVQVLQPLCEGVCHSSTFYSVGVRVLCDRESNVHAASDMTHHISRCPRAPPRPASPPYFYDFSSSSPGFPPFLLFILQTLSSRMSWFTSRVEHHLARMTYCVTTADTGGGGQEPTADWLLHCVKTRTYWTRVQIERGTLCLPSVAVPPQSPEPSACDGLKSHRIRWQLIQSRAART